MDTPEADNYEGIIEDINQSLLVKESDTVEEETEYESVDTSKYSKYDVLKTDELALSYQDHSSLSSTKAEQVLAELELISDDEDELRLI